jgi:hypothetical protein
MARGQKKPAAKKQPAKAPAKAKPKAAKAAKAPKVAKPSRKSQDKAVAAVSELISVLACPKSAVNELALSCEHVLDQMDVSCGFARFTATAWANRPGLYAELDPIARALIAEYERHAEALGRLLDRLAPMAEEDEHADHEDLEPGDVLERVQPMLTAEAAA